MPDDSILILANGDWGDTTRLSDLAGRAAHVIAADGAWTKAIATEIPVDCVIGDLDSLTPADRAALRSSEIEAHVYPPDKNRTDLELAVDHALSLSPVRLIVFGALGGRLDHTLANVLLLEKAVERGVEVELIAGDETAWLIRGEFTLADGRTGDRISLVPLSRRAVVRTDGLRYALNDQVLFRSSARGVSNVIDEVPVRIAVRSGTLVVVHGPPQEELAR
jgi:thiamine pyrophosphokinase